jgi:hypothetical protein
VSEPEQEFGNTQTGEQKDVAVLVDEHEPAVSIEFGSEQTAAGKIMRTLRELSRPDPDAGELELMLSSVAMGMESALGAEIERTQASGELDQFIGVLTRWIATHRSESAKKLVVLELPRHRSLPAGTRLHLLEQAEEAAESAGSLFG